MPEENTDDFNVKSVKKFYSMPSNLWECIVREYLSKIRPSNFAKTEQLKLTSMPNDNKAIITEHIRLIYGMRKASINCSKLYTSPKEIEYRINELSTSGAKDICMQSTREIKKLGKSPNFIKWIAKLWNKIVDDREIPDILKRDKIIYIWKKEGL